MKLMKVEAGLLNRPRDGQQASIHIGIIAGKGGGELR